MLIDTSYFVATELDIANSDTPPIISLINWFIAKYEPAYLIELLGPTIYADYIAGIALDPIPQQWTDLQNQLRNDATKVSPIANYIYFFYTRNNTSYAGGTGRLQPKNENANQIDPKIVCSRAWNEMNTLSFQVYKFLKTNASVYGCLPYDLRFFNADWLSPFYTYGYWWGFFPFNLRRCIPEIYRPIDVSNVI